MRKIILLTVFVVFYFLFPDTVFAGASIVPAATTPNGKYSIVLDNNPPYSGPISIKSWVCEHDDPKKCSTPTEYKPWKDANGNQYLVTNNSLEINLGGLNIPEKLYFIQVADGTGNYSAPAQVNVTYLADYPAFTNSIDSTTKLTIDAIDKYLSTYPILDQPGPTGKKIKNVYSDSSLTDHQKAKGAIQIVCGEEPAASEDPNRIADYRHCAAAYAYMLMSYHAFTNQNNMVTPYAYIIVFQMDSLVSTKNDPPFHGKCYSSPSPYPSPLVCPLHLLGETEVSRSYVNDFGMGVLSGLAWLRPINRISQSYCSPDELRNGDEGTCKTIDLYERIRNVSKKIITTTQNYEKFRTDPGFLSRSAMGRAMAAYLTGDAALFSDMWKKVLEYVPIAVDPDRDPLSFLYLSDLFQHTQIAYNLNNWTVPNDFKAKEFKWTKAFFNLYFDKNNPIADLENNYYSESNFRTKFPNQPVFGCHVTGDGYHKNTDDSGLVRITGEQLSDAITTISPPLYLVLTQSNQPGIAQEVLDINNHILRTIIKNPPDPDDEMCDPGTIFGKGKSRLAVALRTFAYLYYSVVGFAKSPYGNFLASPIPSPALAAAEQVPGDANKDNKVNEADYKIWFDNYNKSLSGKARVGDFNSDGKVDGVDYAVWFKNYTD